MRILESENEFLQIIKQLDLSVKETEHLKGKYKNTKNGQLNDLLELAYFFHEYSLLDEAQELFRKAADLECAEALYMLGNYAFEGLVDPEDENEAFLYYEKAAHLGYPDAMNNLADMYLNGEAVVVDEKLALLWFGKAADLGVVEAMFTLGMMFEQGIGVAIDEQQALHFYRMSAAGGDLDAIYRMGMIYMTPLLNERKDMKRAIEFFIIAGEKGHVDALYNLGYIYEFGIGVDIDGHLALQKYKEAGELGDVASIEAVIRLYKEGTLIMRDEIMAQKWKRMLSGMNTQDLN